MKPIYKLSVILVLILAGTSGVGAQLMRTSYFMDKTFYRTRMNPAFIPEQGFLTIPLLGSFGASYTSNSLALSDVFYVRDGRLVTFLDASVSPQEVLKGMKSNNQFNVDFHYDLAYFGWHRPSGFWTAGLGLRTTVSAAIPKSLFEFAKVMNTAEGTTYDLSNIRARAEAYMEMSVGYSRRIDERLTVGGKLKLLPALGSADMRFTNLHAELYADQWRIRSQGELHTSVYGTSFKHKEEEGRSPYVNGMDYDTFGLAGFGAAVDLGATYKVLDNLTVSASVVDLGFTSWSKKATSYAKVDTTFMFDGFTIPVGNNDNQPTVGDQLSDLKDDLENLFHFEEQQTESGRTTMLCATIVAGIEYSVLYNKISFGLLSTTKFYRPKPYTELTASVNFRPTYWFAATLSYSTIHSSFDTYGVALNFSPRGFNFFLGSDYMVTKVNSQWIPVNARAENVYFGMSVPIGKRERYYRNRNYR